MRLWVLHTAYILQERQVVQDVLRERHLVSVLVEFGESRGPNSITTLAQDFFYPFTDLCWHDRGRRSGRRTGGRTERRGKSPLHGHQNVWACVNSGALLRCWRGRWWALTVVIIDCGWILTDFKSNTGTICEINRRGQVGRSSGVVHWRDRRSFFQLCRNRGTRKGCRSLPRGWLLRRNRGGGGV